MVLVLVFLILLLQAVMLFRMSRSWLFPPALYGLYWAVIVAASTVVRFGSYRLTTGALLVFLVGALSFSAGGLAALSSLFPTARAEPVSPRRKAFIQRCIIAYGAGLLVVIPFFVAAIREAGEVSEIWQFPLAARTALGEGDRAGIPRFFLSLTSVGGVLAYCAAWLYEGGRRDKVTLVLAVVPPLIMSILTFARSPVYMIVTGVLGIMAFRGTIRPRTVLATVALALGLALGMGALLGKGPEFGTGRSRAGAIVENLAVYFVGGPVGFGQVMENPASVGEKGLSLRFFTQVAHSFGAPITLPDNVLGYFSDVLGNVYTIYFAYWLDGGWWGVVLVAFLAGFICTAVYVLARKGMLVAGVALGLVIGALLNSATGDGLFGSAMPWLLVLAVVGVLWSAPTVAFWFFGGFAPASETGARATEREGSG